MDQLETTAPEEESEEQEEKTEQDYTFKAIPTIKYYQKTYANGMSNNDKKAVHIFKEFEPIGKIKRIKAELTAVSQGKVDPKLLDAQVGTGRRGRYGSYDKWAKVTLALLLQGN